MKIYHKNKDNKIAGKFLYDLKLCTKNSSYHIKLNKKTKGFDQLGRMFFKNVIMEKDLKWLQDVMQLYDNISKN